MFQMTNMRVSGLSNAVVTAFKLNEIRKTTKMSLICDFKVIADVTLRLDDKDKIFTGEITLTSKVKIISQYNFDIETDSKGMEHLCIGQETTRCECIADPRFALDDVLCRALVHKPELQTKLLSMELIRRRKKLVSQIAEMAVPKLFEEHRQECRAY